MVTPARSFGIALLAFGAALIATGVVVAVLDYVSFHPGGEFNAAWQRAFFDLFVWIVLALPFCGGAFALSASLLVPAGRVLPVPQVVGIGAGAVVVWALGTGKVHRVLELPPFVIGAAAALIIGCIAVAVGRPVRRQSSGGE